MKIIGLGGTDASGKDSVADVIKSHGWLYVSVSEILREELRKLRLPLARQNLRTLSAEWRREHGPDVLIDKALEEFKSAKGSYRGLVIASLRHPAEVNRVHELGGKVVWTDANPHVRYERLVARRRGSEDEVTFDEFLSEEQQQMSHSGDDATLNLGAVKQKSDVHIDNNGNDIEAFKDEVEKKLSSLL